MKRITLATFRKAHQAELAMMKAVMPSTVERNPDETVERIQYGVRATSATGARLVYRLSEVAR